MVLKQTFIFYILEKANSGSSAMVFQNIYRFQNFLHHVGVANFCRLPLRGRFSSFIQNSQTYCFGAVFRQLRQTPLTIDSHEQERTNKLQRTRDE